MEKILADFLEMVQVDAISFDERKVADICLRKLEELGCVDIYEDKAGEKVGGNTGNIFARFPGTLPGSILFSAHMDRMPQGFGIEPVIEDGIVKTKGDTILAADDLGGIAAIFDGIRKLKACGQPHPTVEILLTICEEKGLLGSLHFDYADIKSEISYALDSPGHIGRILIASPHSAKLQVEVFGKAAHAGSEPEKGKSAAVGAAKILANLREGRLDHESTSNFPIVEAGHGATNAVCDYAIIKGEARSIDKQKLMDYIAYFEKHCQETAEAFGVTAKTAWNLGSPGYKVEKNSASVRLISEVFAQMGVEPLPEASGGGMDANRYNSKGIQSVGLATGYFDNHTTNEHVFLDSFLRTGEMVMRTVLEYGAHKDKYTV